MSGVAPYPPTTNALPDVTGLGINEAYARLDAAGYEVEVIELDDQAIARIIGGDPVNWPRNGTVVAQAPPPTTPALPSTTIVLSVAQFAQANIGDGLDATPNLVGFPLDQANRLLAARNLTSNSIPATSEQMIATHGVLPGRWPMPGVVIEQYPPAGTSLPPLRNEMDLLVSAWTLAGVSGDALVGSPSSDIQALLRRAGFMVQVNEVDSEAVPGTVLNEQLQFASSGAHTVVLEVARAPVTDPDSNVPDTDSDGVPDMHDHCAGTPAGTAVDATGCQRIPDRDGDGVSDALDQCPDTGNSVTVDAVGCELDSDGDRVVDRLDQCPNTPPGTQVNALGCISNNSNDNDDDGVNDAYDRCPGTPSDSVDIDEFGCTLTQKVDKLKTGLYAFNGYTSMDVDGKSTYDIVLVLDPSDSRSTSELEAVVINALPPAAVTPRPVTNPSATAACRLPIRCIEAKWHEHMEVRLGVDQEGWLFVPDPDGPRVVTTGEKTFWRWTVTPACHREGWFSGKCKDATLNLTAWALIDNVPYGPLRILDETITVEVTLGALVASFFTDNNKFLFGSLIIPVIIALVPWWLKRRRRAHGSAGNYPPVSVLFIGANPQGTSRIRLDQEVRAIDQSLRLGEHREAFTLHQHWAARVSELDDALMRYQPNIVHISAHGTQNGELLFEGGEGADGKLSAMQLERLFGILSDNIRLVILNACFSEEQAQRIVNHVDCVVGMSEAVNDKMAMRFSKAFYLALANGRSVRTAFDLACAEAGGAGSNGNEQVVPRLLALRTSPEHIIFTGPGTADELELVNKRAEVTA